MDAYIYQGDNYHHCVDCGSIINFGDMVFRGKWGYRCYTCQYYYDKRKSESMKHRCAQCNRMFDADSMMFVCHRYGIRFICRQCSERENMPNIKITAEVDGKQVSLRTISTESFEAIKALEKPKEIPVPVARVGNFPGDPSDRRLFLKITDGIRNRIVDKNIKMIAIELRGGNVVNSWTEVQHNPAFHIDGNLYENIKPL